MSDSVTLRKTRGIIWSIVSLILFALEIFCIWILFHSSSEAAILLLFPITFLFFFFYYTCTAVYNCFIETGKCMEKEDRKKKRLRPISEDNEYDDEKNEPIEKVIDISSIEDSVQLQKTYGILSFIAGFVLLAGIIFVDLTLLAKSYFFLFFLYPEILIFMVIYGFLSSACEYFMKAGKYLEKMEELDKQ